MGVMIDLQPSAGPALVVGGGTVATRRARLLSEAAFEIVVVAPVAADDLRLLPSTTLLEREFTEADIDLRAFSLVLACTDSREVNALIGRLARARRIPVAVADAQDESTFFTPATIRDGDLVVAVSTGGASPGLSRVIRERVVTALGPKWPQLLHLARTEREERLKRAREAMQ